MTEKKFEKANMTKRLDALQEAKQVLAAEEAKRIQACAAAIQAVLAKHGCNLVPVPQLTPDGRIVALVQIRSVVEE